MDVQSKSRRQLKGISMQERLKLELQGKELQTVIFYKKPLFFLEIT
jgi:hypothetical protein